MSITAEEIIDKLEEALRQFGEYNYYDKGPDEILDVGMIAVELMSMAPSQAGQILAELAEHQHGDRLRDSLLDDMGETMDDSWFDECYDTSGAQH